MTAQTADHRIPDPPPEKSVLGWLLDPVSPSTFRSQYWQRRPLHVRGPAQKFAGLFGVAALRDVIDQGGGRVAVRVSGDHEGDGGAAAAHLLIDGSEVADHIRSGTSVCIDSIDRVSPALATLALALKRDLGHAGPVDVKCYYSTPGYGFNTHFDAHVVTTLQIEGRKRWRFSPTPGVPYPTDNAFLDETGTIRYVGRPPSSLASWETPTVDTDRHVEVVLEPGDVLCLPAGTWHSAKADGDRSLALNISFPAADPMPLLLALLGDELRQIPEWRAGIPLATPESAPPETIGRYLADRLDELRAAAARLGSDPRLVQSWRDAVERPDGTAVASGTSAVSAAARAAVDRAGDDGALQCVLGVTDVQRSARWYAAVLGSTVLRAIPEFGWVEMSTPVDGVTLGLTEVGNATTNAGAVLDFRVDDLERIRSVLAAQGVQVDDPVTDVPGVARFLSARDLDGNRLMFFSTDDDSSRGQDR